MSSRSFAKNAKIWGGGRGAPPSPKHPQTINIDIVFWCNKSYSNIQKSLSVRGSAPNPTYSLQHFMLLSLLFLKLTTCWSTKAASGPLLAVLVDTWWGKSDAPWWSVSVSWMCVAIGSGIATRSSFKPNSVTFFSHVRPHWITRKSKNNR